VCSGGRLEDVVQPVHARAMEEAGVDASWKQAWVCRRGGQRGTRHGDRHRRDVEEVL
jgi:hypothetical protein